MNILNPSDGLLYDRLYDGCSSTSQEDESRLQHVVWSNLRTSPFSNLVVYLGLLKDRQSVVEPVEIGNKAVEALAFDIFEGCEECTEAEWISDEGERPSGKDTTDANVFGL